MSPPLTLNGPGCSRFAASEKLVVGTHDNLKIASISTVFARVFLAITEEGVESTVLKVFTTRDGATDSIALAHFHYFLTLQGDGREGLLPVDGRKSSCLIDRVPNYRVFVKWRDGWELDAVPEPTVIEVFMSR